MQVLQCQHSTRFCWDRTICDWILSLSTRKCVCSPILIFYFPLRMTGISSLLSFRLQYMYKTFIYTIHNSQTRRVSELVVQGQEKNTAKAAPTEPQKQYPQKHKSAIFEVKNEDCVSKKFYICNAGRIAVSRRKKPQKPTQICNLRFPEDIAPGLNFLPDCNCKAPQSDIYLSFTDTFQLISGFFSLFQICALMAWGRFQIVTFLGK